MLARKRQATTLARWEAQNKEMVDETFALRTLKRTLSMFEEKLADIEDERGEPVPYDYQVRSCHSRIEVIIHPRFVYA